MNKEKLGKLLYRSNALIPIKILFMSVLIILTVNLYLQTYLDSDFLKWPRKDFWGVIDFHLFYPEQIISLFLSTFIPTVYYSFFRGIRFYEEGMIVNKGLPFMNHIVMYSDIDSYKVVHQKYLMSVRRKNIEEDLLFTVRDIDRCLAIFDQHNIEGNLGHEEFDKAITTTKKLVVFYIAFGLVVTALQYSGFFIWINQLLFR